MEGNISFSYMKKHVTSTKEEDSVMKKKQLENKKQFLEIKYDYKYKRLNG